MLDEPTNDLDFETLRVLEGALVDYQGCLVVVSHDRAFMGSMCTFILELPGDGSWQLHAGNWSEWQARTAAEKRTAKAQNKAKKRQKKAAKANKLSYMEQKRLQGIEREVESVDDAVAVAEATLADPSVVTDYTRLQPATLALDAAMAKRDKVYAEWERLEAKQALWNEQNA